MLGDCSAAGVEQQGELASALYSGEVLQRRLLLPVVPDYLDWNPRAMIRAARFATHIEAPVVPQILGAASGSATSAVRRL